MLNKKYGILLIVLLSMQMQLWSQAASPYSRYGLGNLRNTSFSAARSMGGLQSAYNNWLNINYGNPASYGGAYFTSFETGVNIEAMQLRNSDSRFNFANGSLSHLAMQFPVISRTWGSSVGLVPYSNSEFQIQQDVEDPTLGPSNKIFTGEGSTYKLYWGNGFRYRHLAIGVNLNYFFGQMKYEQYLFPSDTSGAYNVQHFSQSRLSGFDYNIGLMYDFKLTGQQRDTARKPAIEMLLGATAKTKSGFNSHNYNFWRSFYQGSSSITYVDTQAVLDSNGNFVETNTRSYLPASYSFGFTIRQIGNKTRKSSWTVGADYAVSDWTGFIPVLDNRNLSSAWRLSLGGEWIPDKNATKSDGRDYLRKISYRSGFFYGKSELSQSGNQFNETGFTLGLGLPVRNSASVVNAGFEYRHRGQQLAGSLEENYFSFILGFSLNDRWFIKRRYD